MKSNRIHLSLLIFFQVSVSGAFMPILSLYLKDYAGLSSLQIGIIFSISSIPSVIIPVICLLIVDRIITARRLMLLSHFSAALLIFLLSVQHEFLEVLIIYTLYMIALFPSFGLINSLIFYNLDDRNSYSAIKIWGAVGWAVSGWLISFIWKNSESPGNMPIALIIAGFFSLIVFVLTMKLPRMNLKRDKKVSLFTGEALTVLLRPKILLIFIVLFIISITDKFYYFGAPIYLKNQGISSDIILVLMSITQIVEMLSLFVLSPLIKRFGFKNIFFMGLLLQTLRFILFFPEGSVVFSIISLSLGGVVYALFFAGSLIYLDGHTDNKSKGGVHQIYNLFYLGISSLIGNLAAGLIAENFMIGEMINFKIFWAVPGAMSLISVFLVHLFMERVNTLNQKISCT